MITAERTLDAGVCLDVLTNKVIFNAISEDGATFENLVINVFSDYWVKLLDGQDVVGVAQFKPMFNKCYDCHIHILPEHRKQHSMGAGRALIDWCKGSLPDCLLFTTVPNFCPNVIAFLKAFDFEESGALKGAWKKNGKQNDMTILTRGI